MLPKVEKALTKSEMQVALRSIQNWDEKSVVKASHKALASYYLRMAARWPTMEKEMHEIGFISTLKQILMTPADSHFETPMNIDKYFVQVSAYCGSADNA